MSALVSFHMPACVPSPRIYMYMYQDGALAMFARGGAVLVVVPSLVPLACSSCVCGIARQAGQNSGASTTPDMTT